MESLAQSSNQTVSYRVGQSVIDLSAIHRLSQSVIDAVSHRISR